MVNNAPGSLFRGQVLPHNGKVFLTLAEIERERAREV